MSKFFSKPKNVSYDQMEEYVNTADLSNDDSKLFTYLYFLSTKYANDKGFRVNAKQLDKFSIRCACKIYDILKQDHISYIQILDDIAYDILVEISMEDDQDQCDMQFMFNNHLIDLLECSQFSGKFDITNFCQHIRKFMLKLPRKKYSAEWRNTYLSVLLSIIETLNIYGAKLFEYPQQITPEIILYELDDCMRPYVNCLVSLMLCNLRDNFNSAISSRYDTIYSIRLKELLRYE